MQNSFKYFDLFLVGWGGRSPPKAILFKSETVVFLFNQKSSPSALYYLHPFPSVLLELTTGIEKRIEDIKERNINRLNVIRQDRIRLSIRVIVLGMQIEKAAAEKDVITVSTPAITSTTAAGIEITFTSPSPTPCDQSDHKTQNIHFNTSYVSNWDKNNHNAKCDYYNHNHYNNNIYKNI